MGGDEGVGVGRLVMRYYFRFFLAEHKRCNRVSRTANSHNSSQQPFGAVGCSCAERNSGGGKGRERKMGRIGKTIDSATGYSEWCGDECVHVYVFVYGT